MTQYLLSLPHDSAEEPTMASMDPAELEATMAITMAFMEELTSSGALVYACGLMPPSSATTIDGTGDEPSRTPGPFVEAPEYLGGFWVVEAADEEAALEWGTKAAQALKARIEVRAVQEPPAEEG